MSSKGKNIRKKTTYRHSTTFYRKLKQSLLQHMPENNPAPENIPKYFNSEQNLQTRNIHDDETMDKNNVEINFVDDATPLAAISLLDYSTNDDNADGSVLDDLPNEFQEISIRVSKFSIWQKVRELTVKHNLNQSTVNSILSMLRELGLQLPIDCRTLLQTPKSITLETMGNGEFWYNGVKNSLVSALYKSDIRSVSLICNVDGLPPFKSAHLELWPILIKIQEIPHLKPVVVAAYCGHTKPPIQSFLVKFITEMKDLLKNGIICNGIKIAVQIKYFVCDTPARSFIKGTVGFNAAHGCIKCTVVGAYDKGGRHMSFPNINCPLRTDESFRLKLDEDHHKENSPLEQLPINMVEDIIVADSLHLFELGVMRKCLNGWVHGNYNFRTKFSGRDIDLICGLLEDCNRRKPFEIHRAIRTLRNLKFWKGTEYRTFLLYVGPVVLKDFLSVEVYHNYLTLFCAATILSCKLYLKNINIAEQLLNDFIGQFINIYGQDAISSNVHNLCHVANDVKKFGSLSEISTYPFENYLGILKGLLRSGNRPLAQIAKRLTELSLFNLGTKNKYTDGPYVKYEVHEQHQLHSCKRVFNKLFISEDFVLSNDIKNKWFLTKYNEVVSMTNATYFEESIHIYGLTLKQKHDFFTLPIKSSYLNIYQSDGKVDKPKLVKIQDVKCKLICLKYRESLVFLPLLHTLDKNL